MNSLTLHPYLLPIGCLCTHTGCPLHSAADRLQFHYCPQPSCQVNRDFSPQRPWWHTRCCVPGTWKLVQNSVEGNTQKNAFSFQLYQKVNTKIMYVWPTLEASSLLRQALSCLNWEVICNMQKGRKRFQTENPLHRIAPNCRDRDLYQASQSGVPTISFTGVKTGRRSSGTDEVVIHSRHFRHG